MRARSILLGGAAIVAIASAAIWFTSYDPSEFHGSGPIRDTGLFTYYRYRAPLGDIPLAIAGSYTLRFSGVPSEHMLLQLYVAGGSDSNRELLQGLSTRLSVQIVDAHGIVLCSATGVPGGINTDRWTLMSGGYFAAFWHNDCSDIPFKRRTEYVLTVVISDVDPRSPRLLLTATLEGGGIELS